MSATALCNAQGLATRRFNAVGSSGYLNEPVSEGRYFRESTRGFPGSNPFESRAAISSSFRFRWYASSIPSARGRRRRARSLFVVPAPPFEAFHPAWAALFRAPRYRCRIPPAAFGALDEECRMLRSREELNHAVLRGAAAADDVFEGVGREARYHRVRHAPSEDLPDEDVDDESSRAIAIAACA